MFLTFFSCCVAFSQVLAASSTGEPFASGMSWISEPITAAVVPGDSVGIAGIAASADGELQVVFESWHGSDWGQRRLCWSARVNNQWQPPEVIAEEAPFAHGFASRTNYLPAIAVDADGNPHVSFRAPYSRPQEDGTALGTWRINSLEHAFRDSNGTWTRHRVDDVFGDEGSSSLEITASGQVLVAFRWRHKRFDDDVAVVQSMDAAGELWSEPCPLVSERENQEHVSLALAADGAPRIVCTATVPGSGGHGKRIGFAAATPAAEGDSACVFGSFVFREENRLLLPGFGVESHMDNAALAIGGPDGAPARTLVVFNGNVLSQRPALYCSYADADPEDPASWSAPQLLDEDAVHPSIVIDAEGKAWVVYQKRNAGSGRWSVLVISGQPGEWSVPQYIDPSGGDQRVEWEEPAIVVDSTGVLHVVYNVDRLEIRHAWTQVESGGGPGRRTEPGWTTPR